MVLLVSRLLPLAAKHAKHAKLGRPPAHPAHRRQRRRHGRCPDARQQGQGDGHPARPVQIFHGACGRGFSRVGRGSAAAAPRPGRGAGARLGAVSPAPRGELPDVGRLRPRVLRLRRSVLPPHASHPRLVGRAHVPGKRRTPQASLQASGPGPGFAVPTPGHGQAERNGGDPSDAGNLGLRPRRPRPILKGGGGDGNGGRAPAPPRWWRRGGHGERG
mmetsp:Transcript_29024/g.64930  ORF Transcript_29024/g.64930 Transcript_29024/m.64930 type:complete len:217 (+) Transcript_29024:1019-1669(+)